MPDGQGLSTGWGGGWSLETKHRLTAVTETMRPDEDKEIR